MTTTVVSLKHTPVYDVYIGRSMPKRGLLASPWGNPYRPINDAERAVVLAKYRSYLARRENLVMATAALRGKRLACWCKEPDRDVACHGDILAELAEMTNTERWQWIDAVLASETSWT